MAESDIAPETPRSAAVTEGHRRGEDRLGTYDRVDGATRAAALGMLDFEQPIQTFSLGEVLFDGYPGWATRRYEQHLAIGGFDPGPGFAGEVISDSPRGPNEMTSLEERVVCSFNIGSKVNGLAHAGRGHTYYGGRRLPDLVSDHGVTDLDTTTWGPPLLTRGLMFDVLSLIVELGADELVDVTDDGTLHLVDDYRITSEDLEQTREHQGLPQPRPGDALFVRTGWRNLIRADPERYMHGGPGVWLRETEWLASFQPGLVGTDSWCWGTRSPDVVQGRPGACHQVLLVDHGIRLAESMNLEELVSARVDRFVLVHAPVQAMGAVSTIAPPIAIANERPPS